MSTSITMTEFLRNPKKIREMVQQGIKIYVTYEGKVSMVITLPAEFIDSKKPKQKLQIPTVNAGTGDRLITREDIYGENSWLDKE